MDLIPNCSIPCLNQLCWDLISTWLFVTLWFFITQLNLLGTRLRHSWFCCVYFCLPNIINPMYIQQLRDVI